MKTPSKTLSRSGLLNLLIVYLVWSSTYLAIRVAVSGPTGFHIATAGYIRMFLAGVALLCVCIWQKSQIIIPGREFLGCAVSGALLLVGGNGLIMWSEQRADSGFAALVVACTPLLIAVINSILDKQAPGGRLTVALVISFIGLAFLVGPTWKGTGSTDLKSALGLIAGALSWAAGSVYQARQESKLPATVIAAYQHLCAGVLFLLIAVGSRDYMPSGGTNQWMALLYLVVFGSVLAFTAYVKALQSLPIYITMTYAFVNPVLALLLGWLILDEHIGAFALLGAFLVILGLFGVFREHLPQSEGKVLQEGG